MALIDTGLLLSNITGSVGANTFVNAGRGTVLRPRPLRSDSRSRSQILQRSVVAAYTRAWHSLSESERQAWRNAARQITRVDRLGKKYSPGGYRYFLASTTFLNLPNAAAATPLGLVTPMMLANYLVAYTSTTSITWSGAPSGPVPEYASFYGARSFDSDPGWKPRRWAKIIEDTAPSSPYNVWGYFKNVLGTPVTGEYIAVAWASCSFGCWPSPKDYLTCVVQASP